MLYGYHFSDSENTPLNDDSILAGSTKFVTVWLNITNIGDSTSCVKLNVSHSHSEITLTSVTSIVPNANMTNVCEWLTNCKVYIHSCPFIQFDTCTT